MTRLTVNWETYRRPVLSRPGGAGEGVAGLQDGRLGGVQTLPLLRGGDAALQVLLHAGHGAALDAPAARRGAGRPGAALPTGGRRGDGGGTRGTWSKWNVRGHWNGRWVSFPQDARIETQRERVCVYVCVCEKVSVSTIHTYRGRGW